MEAIFPQKYCSDEWETKTPLVICELMWQTISFETIISPRNVVVVQNITKIALYANGTSAIQIDKLPKKCKMEIFLLFSDNSPSFDRVSW